MQYFIVMGDTSFFGFDTIPVRYHEFWSIPIPKSIPITQFFPFIKITFKTRTLMFKTSQRIVL